MKRSMEMRKALEVADINMSSYYRDVVLMQKIVEKSDLNVSLVSPKNIIQGHPQQFIMKTYYDPKMPPEVMIHKHLSEKDPNILKVYDDWHDDNYYYMCIEYFENEDLHHYLEHINGASIGFANILIISYRLAENLNTMHEEKICHRDIKPLNVYLNLQENSYKLAGFGQAKYVEDVEDNFDEDKSSTHKRQSAGNPYKDDIWALGNTFIQIAFSRLCPEISEMGISSLHNFITDGFERAGCSLEFTDLLKRMIDDSENFNMTAQQVANEISDMYEKYFSSSSISIRLPLQKKFNVPKNEFNVDLLKFSS